MIRRGVSFLTRRTILWQEHPKVVVVSKQQFILHHRNFSSGSMLEAEIVSPLEKDLKEALANHRQIFLGGAPTKKEIQESLETIRRFQYRMEKWEEALKTEEELHYDHYDSPLEMAQTHNRLAVLHQNLQNHSKSRSHFEASLRYFKEEVHPPNIFHAEIGEACNHLAALAAEEVELELAMRWLDRSEPHFRHHGKNMFEINEDDEDGENQKKEPAHPELRKCLENQGKILRFMGRHEEALQLYLEIEKNLLMDDKEPDRDLKLDMADCLLTLRRSNEAEELYISVLEEIDFESLTAAAIHHQLGLIDGDPSSDEGGDGTTALMHFGIALALRRRLLGDAHLNVAKTLTAMGVVKHVFKKDPAASLADLREALIIYRTNSDFENDEDDPEVKKVLKNISLVQKDMQRPSFRSSTE